MNSIGIKYSDILMYVDSITISILLIQNQNGRQLFPLFHKILSLRTLFEFWILKRISRTTV